MVDVPSVLPSAPKGKLWIYGFGIAIFTVCTYDLQHNSLTKMERLKQGYLMLWFFYVTIN